MKEKGTGNIRKLIRYEILHSVLFPFGVELKALNSTFSVQNHAQFFYRPSIVNDRPPPPTILGLTINHPLF